MTTAIEALSHALSPQPAESAPTFAQRVDAAIAEIMASDPAKKVQALATDLRTNGEREWQDWRSIMESVELNPTGKATRELSWGEQYAGQLVPALATGQKHISVVRAYILPCAPSFAPANAVEATIINGVMADFDAYDPDVAADVARQAVAQAFLPLCARIRNKLTGFTSWKRPFVESQMIADVLEELAEVLATPDLVRSDAAKQWCAAADVDLKYFVRELWNGKGKANVLLAVDGSLPTLFPPQQYARA